MARAMLLIGFAAAASADTGPSARQLRGYAANATSLAQAQAQNCYECSSHGYTGYNNRDNGDSDRKWKETVYGTNDDWWQCAKKCDDHGDGCAGWSFVYDSSGTDQFQCWLKPTIGDKDPNHWASSANDISGLGKAELQLQGQQVAAEETTTALPPSEDVNTTAGDAPTSSLFQGLSSGPSYYCGGTWNQNNNWGSNYGDPIGNTDTETCKRLCGMSGSNKCTGWTVTNNNECYLKTGVGDMQSDTGVQGSGYCYPSCGDQQNGQNNDGQNYDGPIQVQNAEFCKARCQASGECRGWTVTNDGECYLKSSVGPMRPDGGVQASGNC